MNILITGANGFVGKSLSSFFNEQHAVYKIVRSLSGLHEINEVQMDLTDAEDVRKKADVAILNELQFDIFVNCASKLSTTENNTDLSVFYDNIRITENVIYLVKKYKPRKLINFSTIGIYPNIDGIYTEQSIVKTSVNAECLYSLSKFCSEELFDYSLREQTVINLRLSQTFGMNMRKDRIYSVMLNELLSSNTITVWGNGERSSNFISIEYLCSIMDKIIASDNFTGTYNVGEMNITYLQLADMLIGKYGNHASRIILVENGVRSKVIIDCTKLFKSLN